MIRTRCLRRLQRPTSFSNMRSLFRAQYTGKMRAMWHNRGSHPMAACSAVVSLAKTSCAQKFNFFVCFVCAACMQIEAMPSRRRRGCLLPSASNQLASAGGRATRVREKRPRQRRSGMNAHVSAGVGLLGLGVWGCISAEKL